MKMKDWLIYSILALIFWGLWVVLPKFAIKYIDVKNDFIYQTIGGIFVALIVLGEMKFQMNWDNKGVLLGLLAGICGALGTYYFLKAMESGKSIVVIPLTALYPIIGVLLSFFLFKEIITIKQLVGVIFAIISVFMLAS